MLAQFGRKPEYPRNPMCPSGQLPYPFTYNFNCFKIIIWEKSVNECLERKQSKNTRNFKVFIAVPSCKEQPVEDDFMSITFISLRENYFGSRKLHLTITNEVFNFEFMMVDKPKESKAQN